jgi:hypothetical protein
MALQSLIVGLVLVSNDWNVGTNCEERQMACFEARTTDTGKKQQSGIALVGVGRNNCILDSCSFPKLLAFLVVSPSQR